MRIHAPCMLRFKIILAGLITCPTCINRPARLDEAIPCYFLNILVDAMSVSLNAGVCALVSSGTCQSMSIESGSYTMLRAEWHGAMSVL